MKAVKVFAIFIMHICALGTGSLSIQIMKQTTLDPVIRWGYGIIFGVFCIFFILMIIWFWSSDEITVN